MNERSIDDMEKYVAKLESDNKRLQSRDGNATIQLCYNDGNDPFTREDLKVIDVGVADNCYVVESEVVTNLQSANSALQKQVEEKDSLLRNIRDELNAKRNDRDELVIGNLLQAIDLELAESTGSKLLAKVEAGEESEAGK